jgi:hypothetical protein
MRKWQHSKRRLATALSVLLVPLVCSGCGDARPVSKDRGGRAGAAAVGASAVCLIGRPTGEGIECQAFRTDAGDLYTLIGDLGDLAGDEACVCGEAVELSSCMQGTTIAVTRTGPPDICP